MRHVHLHGPVTADACDACHTLLSAERHTYELAREGPQLCSFCHDIAFDTHMFVHEPLKSGDCLDCHNPHGGSDRNLLTSQSMLELCLSCHEDIIGTNEHVHGPTAAGQCTTCHSPHASPRPDLLSAYEPQLCIGCHVSIQSQLHTRGVAHDPAEERCRVCHDPHASDHAALLTQTPLQLCISCHEDVAGTAGQAVVDHVVVTDDRACLHCHVPHSSDTRTLLKDHEITVCLECHATDIHRDDGSVVVEVAELVKPGYRAHGPAREGHCNGCHNPHGGPFRSLLTLPYTQSFYQDFDVKAYALCFSCHEEDLVESESGTDVTGFLDGDLNLHWVHVNQEKGRTCRACHEVHASKQPFHIREEVPFGKWLLKINFAQTSDGGTCSPGCHKTKSYDRSDDGTAVSPEISAGVGNER